MTYQGELIGESENPLTDAARILLARGPVRLEDRIATARQSLMMRTGGYHGAASQPCGPQARPAPSRAFVSAARPRRAQGGGADAMSGLIIGPPMGRPLCVTDLQHRER